MVKAHNKIKYLSGIFLVLTFTLILSSCNEYEFTSPYDEQNPVVSPQDLQVVFLADTAVSLHWEMDFTPGINYTFDIEVSEDGVNYSILQVIKENIDSVIVPYNFKTDQEYHFRLRSRADYNAGKYIAASGKIQFQAPGHMQVSFIADTLAQLSWVDNSTIETGFEILVRTGGGEPVLVKEISANVIQTSVQGIFVIGEVYTFGVRAKSTNNKTSISESNGISIVFNAPGNVSAELITDTSAVVQWHDNSNIELGFQIEQSEDGVNFIKVGEVHAGVTTVTVYSDYLSDKMYTFRVKAISMNNTVTSAASQGVSVRLAAPTDLLPTLNADTSITLKWSYSNIFAKNFEILMSVDGSQLTVVKEVTAQENHTSFEHTFILNKTYIFGIRAKSKNNASEITTAADIKLFFGGPSDVLVNLPSDTVAVISWQDNSNIEYGFEVFMSIDGGPFSLIKEVPHNSTQTDYQHDFISGKVYTFGVRALSTINGVTALTMTNSELQLMQVMDLSVIIPDSALAILSWSNTIGFAREIVVEQSIDGNNYNFLMNVNPQTDRISLTGSYQLGITYWYRIRTNTKNNLGNYSYGNGVYQFYCGFSRVFYLGVYYNTVQIGSQCWLRENLNVGIRINGTQSLYNNDIIEKYCFDNLESNCEKYGGLYSWNEAMQYSTVSGIKGICPDGWHIPSLPEYFMLSNSVIGNSNSLKAVGQGFGSGSGNNSSGFSALLSGIRITNGNFTNLNTGTYFWSSDEYSLTFANSLSMNASDTDLGLNYHSKDLGFSVRCIKN